MKFFSLVLSLGMVAMTVWAAQDEKSGSSTDVTKVTVVTAERLTFDYKKGFAIFENNVLVTDPDMQLACDRLTITFDKDGKAKIIKAEGRVTITQEDKTAHAAVGVYEVDTGKIVLTGKPRVMRGRDSLEGETITFWRDQNRMICQPGARLVIYPEEGGLKDRIGR